MKIGASLMSIFLLLLFFSSQDVTGQWAANGNNIYNTNTGNVGIGNNNPSTLLYVAKNMTEPNITVRNLGGAGGATYSMVDNVSGANWKFKATNSGGFKIRDNAFGLDVFQIESNSAANVIYISSAGSVGFGTSAPAVSALADLTSTTQGFLPPRLTQSQLSAIPNPANGLMVYNTTDEKFYVYVEQVYAWKEVLYGSGTISTTYVCGTPITKSHVAGNVAPVSKTVTYNSVTNIPGETSKCWISQNLGSNYQASAVNDATEASAGWYWQFNRQQGYKHDGTIVTPAWTITSINENSDWTSDHDPCVFLIGTGWRLPTSTEWDNIDVAGGWTNWNGPWNSALKLHAAGHIAGSNGGLYYRGETAGYWGSTSTGNTMAYRLIFGSGECSLYNDDKANAFSVRCLR